MTKSAPGPVPLRVALVERHPLLRAGIRLALDGAAGIEVVAETGEAGQVLSLVRSSAPDVLLMDLDLPGSSSLETCRTLVTESDRTRLLGMTGRGDDEQLLKSALRAGVRGYVAKDAGSHDVRDAVHMVANGFMVASAAAARLFAGLLDPPARDADRDPLPALTRREREILDLVARGYDNPRIARALTVADKTVRNHVSAIFAKIGANGRSQAIVFARDAGFGQTR
ncbi:MULTISPECIES: response regulator [unclassified Streptomyces]|uniref:response regulator n=1 Tax=unclassified Streptomyces TaxID=2593676 RepID=UPI000A7D3806|nr:MULTISPECIES: response regulator transcription factor [unclassified Streptomyces]MCX5145623.1 response regulator transcription factor [Streptomyces sp. NBC_00320]WSN48907.1 response regulator transcription factor [Streptomyces sp. NBC_01296]WSW61686.1 response regulator transcription factor [Streptomyces sp. NBC_00998]